MGPMPATAYQGDHSKPSPQPGHFIVFVWSMLVTVILVAYVVISVILYTEERNYRIRQQELIDSWRAATLSLSPPSSTSPDSHHEWRGRDPERTPFMQYEEFEQYGDLDSSDSDSTDSDAAEEENIAARDGSTAYGYGYGSTDSHPPIGHNEAGACYLPPPYSPAVSTTEDPTLSDGSTLVELADHETGAEAELDEPDTTISPPAEPFSEMDRQDSSGVTASGISELPSEPVYTSNDNDDAQAGPLSQNTANGETKSSSSSSSSSTHGLDGHELVTKIKKAVHWHPKLAEGSSSSSSSSSSPKSGSRRLEEHPGLRKRGGQEE
ncbi:hypothetical protein PG990_013184 [Apiospora arundinis]